MLSAEAVQKLVKLGERLSGEALLHSPREPAHVYWLRKSPGGDYERCLADPPPRHYEAFTLEALCELVKRYESSETTLVLVGNGQATAVLREDADRRELVRLQLPLSEQLEALEAKKGNPMSQREFINFLHIDMHGTIVPGVVALFRSLKFAKSDGGDRQLQVGNEAVAREIKMSVVTGGASLPENADFDVLVYRDHPDTKVMVRCALLYNLEEGTFIVKPLAGEIEDAKRFADKVVIDYLDSHLECQVAAGRA